MSISISVGLSDSTYLSQTKWRPLEARKSFHGCAPMINVSMADQTNDVVRMERMAYHTRDMSLGHA